MARKANAAFMKPLNVSPELAVIVGKGPMPRSEVVKKLWAYIKKMDFRIRKINAISMPTQICKQYLTAKSG